MSGCNSVLVRSDLWPFSNFKTIIQNNPVRRRTNFHHLYPGGVFFSYDRYLLYYFQSSRTRKGLFECSGSPHSQHIPFEIIANNLWNGTQLVKNAKKEQTRVIAFFERVYSENRPYLSTEDGRKRAIIKSSWKNRRSIVLSPNRNTFPERWKEGDLTSYIHSISRVHTWQKYSPFYNTL